MEIIRIKKAIKKQKKKRKENETRGIRNIADTPAQTNGTFNLRVRKFLRKIKNKKR